MIRNSKEGLKYLPLSQGCKVRTRIPNGHVHRLRGGYTDDVRLSDTILKRLDLLNLLVNTTATWDETVPIEGKIGESVAIAKRSGNTWYMDAMTNWTARELNIDLSFLGEGNYKATIVSDGINADRLGK